MSPRRLVFLCMFLMLLGVQASQAWAADGALSRIVVVDDKAYPPFAFLDAQGNPRGITIDIWNLWSRKTGIAVEFQLMDWDAALESVQQGKADAVGGLFRTPDREPLFDFTSVIVRIPSNIFFHEQISGIKGFEDLSGFRVGVVKGDSAEEAIRSKYPHVNLIVYPGTDSMVRAAVSGEVKVFVADMNIALFYLAQTPGGEVFRRASAGQITNNQYVAVRKGNSETLRIIQSGFDQISESEINAIVDEWAGRSLANALPWRKLGIGLVGVLLLIFAVLLWNIQLRRQVYRATRDVEEQHRQLAISHEVIRRSEARWRQLFAMAPIPLACSSEDGTIIEVNMRLTQVLGYTLEDIPTLDAWWEQAYPDPEYRSQVMKTWGDALQHAITFGTDVEPNEYRVACKDGSVRTMVIGAAAGEGIILVSFFDITDRKQAERERTILEAQLQQAQKMESVGRLAGGVAHDFNNMLGVILGNSEMAMQKIDPELPLYADLREISKAAVHSAALTRQLLAFARKQTVAPKVLDLNETVTGMLKMLHRLIGEDIDLVWHPRENLWPVKVDPSQIDQILANLCVNARDAITGVGKVTIETGNTVFDADYCTNHPEFIPGEYVLLAVSDNGCGMEKATLDKLFEPFFTTKEIGKGTGLGLATVYGIARQNNGFINVYSELNQGTTFKIYLPRYMGKTDPARMEVVTKLDLRGNETILLVEDEPGILELTKTILEAKGYTVLAASKPGEAIHLAQEHAGEIHLLMTDVIMPEMNGRDLANNLLTLYPHLRCLFMSGYTADVIAHHGVLDEGVHFIQKPFSTKDLSVKVRDVLDNE